jgi:hypothetical protein
VGLVVVRISTVLVLSPVTTCHVAHTYSVAHNLTYMQCMMPLELVKAMRHVKWIHHHRRNSCTPMTTPLGGGLGATHSLCT